MKKKLLFYIILSLASFVQAYSASPVPPGLPQDPALSTGLLPNGITYYIVSNPSEKGLAQFALVTRRDADEPLQDVVSHARKSMTRIPRFGDRTVRDYLAGAGPSVSLCRGVPSGLAEVSEDATVYRFGSLEVDGRDFVVDSTLLLIFSMVAGQDGDGSLSDNAVIIAGDVDRNSLLSRMSLLSMLVPEPEVQTEEENADSAYVWISRDTAEYRVNVDASAAVARISVTYASPRTPEEYMKSVVPLMSGHMADLLQMIIRQRLVLEMKQADIPMSGMGCRYKRSSEAPGDESFSIYVDVAGHDVEKALDVLASVVSDLDVNGVGVKEYSDVRRESLLDRYMKFKNPVVCNSEYVDRCISAFLYGAAVNSASDRFRFLVRGRMQDSTRTRLFNNFMMEMLDSASNLTLEITADSLYVNEKEVHGIFSGAWDRTMRDSSVISYSVNAMDSLSLAEVPEEKVKVVKTRKEPMSGGTMWLFSNGMKVVYKRMDTGGLFYYDLMVRGGFSMMQDIRKGEGAFLADVLSTYDISGLRSEDFHRLMLSEGISMSYRVGLSDISLYGVAVRPSLTLLMKCIGAVSGSRTLNEKAFEYYRDSELLRLERSQGRFRDRIAAIDSLMCPSYNYSSYKTSDGLSADLQERAMAFFDSQLSRMNDGVFVIVGDMEETAMRKFLQKNMGGFRTMPLAVARINLPYQPISGWTTHIMDGIRQTLDVGMSARHQFSSESYAAMGLASIAMQSELEKALVGTGARASVSAGFIPYPQERVNMLVSVREMDLNGLPLGESGIDPLVLLYKIRPVLARLSATPVPEDRLALYKKILKNMYASRQSSPRYWVDIIRRRYSEGKDLNTKYAEKIDAVTAEEVMEIIAALDSGSKVEYVVR